MTTQSRRVEKTRLSSAVTHLFVATQVEVGRGEYVRQRAEPMEQHGRELYDDDEREEEHKHQTDGFQVQVLLADDDLYSKHAVRLVRHGSQWSR